MIQLYTDVSFACSKIVTNKYSTSFSLGIRALAKRFHQPIYGIYGFVRLADEIVDTFYAHPQQELLEQFELATYQAIKQEISLNPILQAFQSVVHKYQIEPALIDGFLTSMKMDLTSQNYTSDLLQTYIYGSAEVVGLMCLRVFCEGNDALYQSLKAPARRLGAAFQKVNFLRDLKSDYEDRERVYFPNIDITKFTQKDKKRIEADIAADFVAAYEGIKRLPKDTQFGVYTAYIYYLKLFEKIQSTPTHTILQRRIRISNWMKSWLFIKTAVQHSLRKK